MTELPPSSRTLGRRIPLVRRDIGNLLFHFTKRPPGDLLSFTTSDGMEVGMPASAASVLRKILMEGQVIGSSEWSDGVNCICFTEAPIHESHALFSLVALASQDEERPRYEPYGVAVRKDWLYAQGGRPVIYDHPDTLKQLPEQLRYRFVPYDPFGGLDVTWEREWRVAADSLKLDPKRTLVVVPTADEAFELVYEFSEVVPDYDNEPTPVGAYHAPEWLAVSLDIFGLRYDPGSAASPGGATLDVARSPDA